MPIAADMDGLRNRIVADVDRSFARRLKVFPQKGGEADAGRPPHEFSGVLRTDEGQDGKVQGGSGRGFISRVAAGPATITFDPRTYTGPVIKEGDTIRAISRPGQPWFSVSRVDDRDDNRTVLELSELNSK